MSFKTVNQDKIFVIGCITIIFYFIFLTGITDLKLEGDEVRYWQQSTLILEGELLNGNYDDFTNGPVFPLFLSVIRFFCRNNLNLVRVVNLLPFIVGLFLLIKRCFSKQFFGKGLKESSITLYFLIIFLSLSSSWLKLLSENLAFLLLVLFWTYSESGQKKWKRALVGSLLVLTKIIFFYVLLLAIAFAYIFRKNLIQEVFSLFILIFLFCLPWLIYCSLKEKRIVIFSDSGSKAILHLTSRYKYDFGDYVSEAEILKNSNHPYHRVYKKIKDSHLENKQSNEIYTRTAMQNIWENPIKVFSNIVSSYSRFFFNYPTTGSSVSQRNEFYPWVNKFLFTSFGSVTAFICFLLMLKRFASNNMTYRLNAFDLIIIAYVIISAPIWGTMRQMFIVFPFILLEIKKWKFNLIPRNVI